MKRVFLISFFTAVLLSAAILLVANDAFAFVGEDTRRTVTIPEGADVNTVADILKENGLIHFPIAYRLYAGFRHFGETYLSGKFDRGDAMSYDELYYALSARKGTRAQTKVTLPEGFTTDEIIDLFVSMGIGTREGFVDTIQNGGNFGYDFLDEIPSADGRTYRLDGYLFPVTYFVYADSSEKEIILKLLQGFQQKFDEALRMEAAQTGYTVDEVLRLASIVEWEAYYRADMPKIASVFLNRLGSHRYPYLESDATVRYIKQIMGDKNAPTAEDIDNLQSPYNTYQSKGLPPGAICSPGYDAILSVIRPAQTDYFYFLSAKDKTTVFSRTYTEHLKAVADLKS